MVGLQLHSVLDKVDYLDILVVGFKSELWNQDDIDHICTSPLVGLGWE